MTTATAFSGPIFDGDTHLYETPDAFSRYLPAKFSKDWSYEWKTGDDGEFALYVGAQKGSTWKGVLIEDDVGDGAPLLAVAETGHIEDAGGDIGRK